MAGESSTGGAPVPLGFNPLILAAAPNLSPDRKVVQWKASHPGIYQFLHNALLQLQSNKLEPRLLAHLRLRGNFIWGPDDSSARMYLDGDVYGTPRADANGNVQTGLRIPQSGDGRRGGNFEMWFWLTMPITVISVTFAPATVEAGRPSTGTVTLSGAASPEGAVVPLAASSSSLGSVPASITIAGGKTAGTFLVTNTANSPGSAKDLLQVTATLDQSQAKGSLTIVPRPPG